MQPKLMLALALALAVAPLAYAHDPSGTPKNYCEPLGDWQIHEYGSGGPGFALALFVDGNVGGDCDGNGQPGDTDGHSEYAQGGAWILACDSFCGINSDGAGSPTCFGEMAHHAFYGPFSAQDAVLGTPAGILWVAADWYDLSGTSACGDLVSDVWVGFGAGGCPCIVTFPPSLDGSYWVYVSATQGHVDWALGGGGGGDPPAQPPRSNSGSAGGHAP